MKGHTHVEWFSIESLEQGLSGVLLNVLVEFCCIVKGHAGGLLLVIFKTVQEAQSCQTCISPTSTGLVCY